MLELYQFHVKDGVHVPHPGVPDGATYSTGKCLGRVVRLAYPFGWRHFYCDKPCCDRTGQKDEETGEDLGKHHVKCTEDWTFTEFVYCIDCGRVGVVIDEATYKSKLKVEPAWPHQG